MEARITGFKGGRRSSYTDHPIIECIEGNPAELMGKKVIWKTTTGKAIAGKVLKPHGKVAFLTKFDKGLPGNAVGDKVFVGIAVPKIKKKPKKSKPRAKPVKAKKPETKKAKPKKASRPKKVTKEAKKEKPVKVEKKKLEKPKKKLAEKTKVSKKKSVKKKGKTKSSKKGKGK